MKKVNYILLVLLTALTNWTFAQNNQATQYRNAVKDAMYPEASKIDTNLIALSADNTKLQRKMINGEEHILMVSWKTTNFYPDSGAYNTGKYQIWVTASPQLKERLQKEKATNKELRLKQMLGLPPSGQYNIFVEFWVKPSDMFRPCPDKEITDKRCNVCFTAKDSLDTAYISWINQTRISRYYACELYAQYPWTGLGYTYDWNPANKTHRGLSEFVIDVNKTIYVNKIYTTEEYLNIQTK